MDATGTKSLPRLLMKEVSGVSPLLLASATQKPTDWVSFIRLLCWFTFASTNARLRALTVWTFCCLTPGLLLCQQSMGSCSSSKHAWNFGSLTADSSNRSTETWKMQRIRVWLALSYRTWLMQFTLCQLARSLLSVEHIQGGPKKWGHYVWRLRSLHAHIFKMPERVW